ncbi:MAG: MFS transporter [Pelosinus sp.]|nr:MFS transporter [Pelosinus sp.]
MLTLNSSDSIKNMARALKHRNFRLFFIGQSCSLIGTWMQDLAIGWLIYRLTGSPFLLGAVIFFKRLPSFIFGPLAGLVADRYNKLKVIKLTQNIAMLQAVVLAILVMTEQVEVWHIFAFSSVLGIANAFDMPVRQAFIIDMVSQPEDLNNAIALNSIVSNVARLIGPSLAGMLIAIFGEGVCFFINAISFLAVIAALHAMDIQSKAGSITSKDAVDEMREGYSYAYAHPPIKYSLLLLSLVSLFTTPYTVLMPVFATEVLGGGSQTQGYLMSAIGCGAILGAAFLASRPNAVGMEKIIPISATILGIALVGFSQTQSVWLDLIIQFFAGMGMIVHLAATNTLLQAVVDNEKRGRIMSLYAMAHQGMIPFGNLLIGTAASQIGVQTTVLISGLLCLIGVLIFINKMAEMKEALALGHPDWSN